jgi:hypothetical protein
LSFVTHEVPPDTWASYLSEISEDLPPSGVSIETVAAPGGPATRGEHPTLRGFAYEGRDDVFAVLTLRGAAEGTRVERHLVHHPVRIRTDAPDAMPPATIVVDAADGSCTVARIEPVPAFSG